MLDELFADLLKNGYKLNEIHDMDILEFLRLMNLEHIEKNKGRKVDSLFSAFKV